LALPLLAAAGAPAAELRIGLSADVTTMDPHFVAAQPNLTAQQHIFDSLVQTDERSRPVPGIATWRTPDPLTWEFTLRKGVKFHDGTELTTEDVVFSLERPFTITGSPGGFQTYVRPIAAKEIVDRYTVRLKTAAPYGALLQDLAEVMIVSKKAAAQASGEDFDRGKAAVGTGPYKLTRFARGSRIELARHDEYWGGRLPWDRLTLLILPSDPVRTAALLSGQVDAIEHVPSADIARLRKSTAFRLEQTVSWRTIFLHLDQSRDRPPGVLSKAGKPLEKNPFKDLRVRRAMSKAINRQAIAERVMEGLAMPAGNILSPSVIGLTGSSPSRMIRRARRNCWRKRATPTVSPSRSPRPTTATSTTSRLRRRSRRCSRASESRPGSRRCRFPFISDEHATRISAWRCSAGARAPQTRRCAHSRQPPTPTRDTAPGTGAAIPIPGWTNWSRSRSARWIPPGAKRSPAAPAPSPRVKSPSSPCTTRSSPGP
jgi:hypothetical protein